MLLGATPGSSGVTIKLSPLSCNSVLSRPIRQRGYYTLWLLSAAAEGGWVIVRHGGRSGNGWYFYLPTDYHFPFQNRNTIILKHPNIVSCWALSPDSRALSPSSRPLGRPHIDLCSAAPSLGFLTTQAGAVSRRAVPVDGRYTEKSTLFSAPKRT